MPWLSHLNPIPSFSKYRGPYSVGTVDVELPAADLESDSYTRPDPSIGTIAFRIFYPCDSTSSQHRPVRWIQKPQHNVISAYARFLGAGSTLSNLFAYFPQLLYYVNIPVYRDAPLAESPNASNRWPVVVFSHGLGGSRNAYSHICGSLASHGLVVIAPDHRDGSSPIQYVRATKTTEAKTVDYQVYSHKPCQETYEGRDEQLRIRLWELSLLHEALLRIDSGNSLDNLDPNEDYPTKEKADTDIISIFKDKLGVHEPGSITWAGHSFGATTTVQFLKANYYSYHSDIQTFLLPYSKPPASLSAQVTSSSPAILLDPWALPLGSPNTTTLGNLSMPCYSPFSDPPPATTNLLAILSEAFYNWNTNLTGVKRFLTPPSHPPSRSPSPPASSPEPHSSEEPQAPSQPEPYLFYPLNSAHLSQSDFGTLFPRLSRYLAHALEPERTLDLNVRACLEMLRRAGIDVSDTAPSVLQDGVENVDTKDAEDGFVLVEKDDDKVSAEDEPAARQNEGKGVKVRVQLSRRVTGLFRKNSSIKTKKSTNDWKILSKEKGAVRGWIAVDLTS